MGSEECLEKHWNAPPHREALSKGLRPDGPQRAEASARGGPPLASSAGFAPRLLEGVSYAVGSY